MNDQPILVAGIGNIFFGDDAFGVEVAQRLLARPQRPGVRVVDFGIRGLDLVYALLDNPPAVVLIDAVPRGNQPPGTLYVLQPEPADLQSCPDATLEAHSMDPLKVLQSAVAMGARLEQVYIVGCEPTPLADGDETEIPQMSAPVSAAVAEAVAMVDSLLDKLSGRLPKQDPTSLGRPEVSSCSPH